MWWLWFYTPSHSHNFLTPHLSHTNFVTHHFSHNNFVTHVLTHSISLTQLCHTPSFSHHLTHTTLSHTPCHTIDVRFAWQAWHLMTSTFSLRGRRGRRYKRGTWRHPPSLGLVPVAHLGALGRPERRATVCVWQAWHWAALTVSLRGRRGAWEHQPSFCMAGVAQAWHLTTLTFSLRARRGASTFVIRGRRGAC